VTRLRTGQTRIHVSTGGRKDIFFLQTTQNGCGANLVSLLWVPVAIAAGVKGPDCKAHQLPPSGAEVNNNGSCTSILHYAFLLCKMTNLPLPYLNFIISSDAFIT